jgi:hypothetical protein
VRVEIGAQRNNHPSRSVRVRDVEQVVDKCFALESVVAEGEQFLKLINYENKLLAAVQAPQRTALQAMSIASELVEHGGALRRRAFVAGTQGNKTGSQCLEGKSSWSQEAYVGAQIPS